MKAKYLAVVALVIAAPATALAMSGHKDGGDHHRHDGGRMERVDADKDGNITKAEIDAMSAERFKALDKNGDGAITADEAPRLFAPRPDANGDGKVTAEELAAFQGARILKADANGDGVVTKEERAVVREKWKEARKERMERRGEDKPAEAPAAP